VEGLVTDFPLQFEHPLYLTGLAICVPAVWLGLRSMSGLGPFRQRVAIALRVLVLAILVVLLAGPLYAKRFKHLSVVAIVDRSRSVPANLQQEALGYLNTVCKTKPKEDRIGVVYAGETAMIRSLPNTSFSPVGGPTALTGDRTDLEGAVRMAMAVFPSDTAKRIVLISDGNENIGDLRGAAKIAEANKIPIDTVSMNYDHASEIMFERLIVPPNARTGQTISARCVLRSTAPATGQLLLEDSGALIDLDPKSPGLAMPVKLTPGLNVVTILLPIRSDGIHRFAATFTPDDPKTDTIAANNAGVGVTFIFGRGRTLVVDADGRSAGEIMEVLKGARIDAEYRRAELFPSDLVDLMEYDAILLANTPNSSFSLAQQEMMVRYVHDLGGGLVMTGGPEGFGAGGWIGSPVEEALPVVLDPPQKQQMPKGALALIMHSVEMPEGNYWGEQVAISAVRALSRLDLVGVMDYDFGHGGCAWIYPLSPVGDKEAVIAAIKKMQMGDMPDFAAGVNLAYNDLIKCDAGQKHIIIISDGDPSPPTYEMLTKLKEAKITATGVAVYPHSPADVQSLQRIAQITGGRFYHVTDPNQLPKIFIKETQVVRRPLIWEKTFTPRVINPLSELTKGIELTPPTLEGYVLTAEKKELVENVMTSPEGDPILASRQYGLGKTVAFTSDASSRWAKQWLGWPKFSQFWEQVVRWSMRSGESPNFQVSTDMEGQRATVQVEVTGQESGFSNFLDISGAVIDPGLKSIPVRLQQVGPGRYQADFPVSKPGNYVINLQYIDGKKTGMVRGALAVPFAPEFHDLKSNPALLAEVSEIGQGRKLSGNPQTDKFFDHASLAFPLERKPLWKELSILWLVLFLIDVAVRRVALDFKAFFRRVFRGKSDRSQQAVDDLRKHQLEVKKKITRATEPAVAQTRYEPGSPAVEVQTAREEKPVEPKVERQEKPEKDTSSEPSYLERLKQAKQKARDNMKEET
jgi:uncharacterized membrane protein/Mg-chelatase subunit ChlD